MQRNNGISKWTVAAVLLALLLPVLCMSVYAATCPECGKKMTYSVYMEPGCDYEGMGIYTCNSCGYMMEDMIPAKGHNYKSTTTATCTQLGITTYTCSRCGDSYQERTDALGHNYRTTTVEPTCTEDGEKTTACTRSIANM